MIANYLDRFLDPITESWPPDVTATLANWHMDDQVRARIEALREKANDGTLTPEEDDEYKDFVDALDFMSILQLKARRQLSLNPQ